MIICLVVCSTIQNVSNKVYTVKLPCRVSKNDVVNIGKMLSNAATDKFYAFEYQSDLHGPGIHGYINLLSGKPYDLFTIFGATTSAEICYIPGMTDNVGTTAAEIIMEAFQLQNVKAHYSEITFYNTPNIEPEYYNPLVKFCKVVRLLPDSALYDVKFFGNRYIEAYGKSLRCDSSLTPHPVPHLALHSFGENRLDAQSVVYVNLNVDDTQLMEISKKGIADRGPLNLSIHAMRALQQYFKTQGRDPSDIELETFAQTWSEHCKHNIFSSPIDDIEDGLYRHYIKRATEEINSDICVSVFSDNAGGIVFDDNFVVVDKVETHNSPSALDPFGGAETGILGVNRDIIGFGLGAKPIMNAYFFCFAEKLEQELYRDHECKEKILPPQRVVSGVIDGVNSGGNCSGIPTAIGSMYFHSNFCGKPLVFVGCTGIIPSYVAGKPSHIKTVQDGDLIVIIGGRVGKDGIHGATFSSRALEENVGSSVVQIGNPITQKKLSDAIIKEARDLGLYNAITDNGAGGLSSSVGEMGSAGFQVDLEKVPLKTSSILPWEIWVSESQERMTLAVPPEKYEQLAQIMHKHDVEISVIGKFNNSGRACVTYNDNVVMDIDTDFLHNGHPKIALQTETCYPTIDATEVVHTGSIEDDLLNMMARKNVCSKEFLVSQYDHEVQGNSVLKPLQGVGQICADAVVIRPILSSNRGIVKSQGLGCTYGEKDPYRMAACAIDTAIRNSVCAGGNLAHMALIDNFCWSSATEPQRLWQLKEAARACYDYAVAYGTPFVSGKDSMFNDFYGYDSQGSAVHIAAPPSLLISTLGIIEDVENAISPHVKGDSLIYLLGVTQNELDMSEYKSYCGFSSGSVPQVNAASAKLLYQKFHKASKEKIISSAISLHIGGLAVGLIKALIGGKRGATIDLNNVPVHDIPYDSMWERIVLFSESQSRILATVAHARQKEFEALFEGVTYALIGETTREYSLTIANVAKVSLENCEKMYKEYSSSHY